MLDSHAHGKTLGLQVEALGRKHLVHIPGGMSCGKDHGLALVDRLPFRSAGLDAESPVIKPLNISDFIIEMILPSMLADAITNILHHARQLVRTDVRMSVDKNGPVGPEIHELAQDVPDIPSLGRTSE